MQTGDDDAWGRVKLADIVRRGEAEADLLAMAGDNRMFLERGQLSELTLRRAVGPEWQCVLMVYAVDEPYVGTGPDPVQALAAALAKREEAAAFE